MPDQQKTSKKAGIVLFSNVITATTQALTLIVLARILEKEYLGEVLKLIMVYKTAVLLGNLGFNDNPYYFLPKLEPSAWGSFLYQCMRILFVSGLIAGGISFFFFWYFFHHILIGLLFIAVIAMELTTSLIPDFLVAAGRVKASSIFNLALSVLNVATIVVVCLYFDDKVLYLTYGFLIYNVVRVALTLVFNWKIFRHDRGALPSGLLREQLDFGIPLGLSSLAMRINKQVDNYVVAFYFKNEVFAEYSVGSWEIPMLLKIPYSITAVYLAKYTRLFDEKKIAELHQKWLQVGEKIILLIVPITTFFLIFADEVIHLAFGRQFHEAVVVFQIYTLTLYTRVSSYSGLLKSFGESRFILRQSILLITMNFVFNIIGVTTIGLYGAPIGTLTANMIALFLALRKISSVLEVPVRQLLPYAFHFQTLVVSLVCAVGVKWGIATLTDDDAMVIIISAIAFIAAFVAVGKITKLIKPEDQKFILSFLKSKQPEDQ